MFKKEKIIAMTKLAIFEKHKGEEAVAITKFYREDFISNCILQGVIRYTAIFLLLFMMYFLLQGEDLLQKMSFVFLMQLGRKTVLLYLLCLVIFLAIFLFSSYFTYEKALEERKVYEEQLEEILSLSRTAEKKAEMPETNLNRSSDKRKTLQEYTVQPAKKELQHGKKEVPLAKREVQLAKKEVPHSKKEVQDIVLQMHKEGERLEAKDWLDTEDWLDE